MLSQGYRRLLFWGFIFHFFVREFFVISTSHAAHAQLAAQVKYPPAQDNQNLVTKAQDQEFVVQDKQE